MPKYVPTGMTPTVDSLESSDDADLKAAKAASLEQQTDDDEDMKVAKAASLEQSIAKSSDDEQVKAAKAASLMETDEAGLPCIMTDDEAKAAKQLLEKSVSMEPMDIEAPSPTAEADRPAASAAAGSGGSEVLPTPRTQAAEALSRMTLGSEPPHQEEPQ